MAITQPDHALSLPSKSTFLLNFKVAVAALCLSMKGSIRVKTADNKTAWISTLATITAGATNSSSFHCCPRSLSCYWYGGRGGLQSEDFFPLHVDLKNKGIFVKQGPSCCLSARYRGLWMTTIAVKMPVVSTTDICVARLLSPQSIMGKFKTQHLESASLLPCSVSSSPFQKHSISFSLVKRREHAPNLL